MRPGPLAALAAPVLAIAGCLGATVLLAATPPGSTAACGPADPAGPGVSVDARTLPRGTAAGFRGDQLANAAAILAVGRALGVGARGQTIAVMTAIGESGLHVLPYGDAAGPDSRGLFQQRANGAWGSLAVRMNPAASATNFYRALQQVPGWAALPPTLAAHRVQHNADPYYYAPFWDRAVQLVTAVSGTRPVGLSPGTGALPCAAAPPGRVDALSGWTRPAIGPITSGFGMRVNPVTGVYRLHAGTDIGAGCGAPIYAAATGRVVQAGPAPGYGNLITIDHGGGLTTRYGHMYNDGVLTTVGAAVRAGQQIGRIGATGTATGCHLHYEVREAGTPVNPVDFQRRHGAPLQ